MLDRQYTFAAALVVVLSLAHAGTAVAQDVPLEDGRFTDAVETEDGFVVAGDAKPEGGSHDAYAVGVDSEGEELWSLRHGGEGVDYFDEVVAVDDGYLFVGTAGASNKHVKGDAWMVKTDVSGSVDWERRYAEGSGSAFYGAVALDDGYLVVGSSNDGGGLVVRVDDEGEERWNASHGTVVGDVLEVDDGFLLSGGDLGGGSLKTWVGKVDYGGTLDWQRKYSAGVNRFSTALAVDGGYLLGTYRLNQVVKVDAEGEPLWKAEVPMKYVYDVERFDDDRFAIGGGLPSGVSATTSVVEIDGEGEVLEEIDLGYSVTEVIDSESVDEGRYLVVAQSVDSDVLGVVLDEAADGEDAGGDDAGATADTNSSSDDEGNPLGSVSATAAAFLAALALLQLVRRR